jgi:hypothetical protein
MHLFCQLIIYFTVKIDLPFQLRLISHIICQASYSKAILSHLFLFKSFFKDRPSKIHTVKITFWVSQFFKCASFSKICFIRLNVVLFCSTKVKFYSLRFLSLIFELLPKLKFNHILLLYFWMITMIILGHFKLFLFIISN